MHIKKPTYYIPLALLLILLGSLLITYSTQHDTNPPVRIGIIHALSGSMSKNESPLVDAALFAIKEINANGGVLGRPVEAVIEDSRSNRDLAAEQAQRLIVDEKVAALFGCWTSACRKAVKPVVEVNEHLLFYPLQYEGMESSNHIIYTGAAPNQQLIPAIRWALDNLGNRFYLIGSDYIFPRTANLIAKDLITAVGGQVVGEHYVPLGGKQVTQAISEIENSQPDVILNTINGNTNHHLFEALNRANIDSRKTAIISSSISEREILTSNLSSKIPHFTAWSYFQNIDSDKNRQFIQGFRKYSGHEPIIGDPMEAMYVAVHLWAHGVNRSGTLDPVIVRKELLGDSFNTPEGIVSVEPKNGHLWKNMRIAKNSPNGDINIVWKSESPIEPHPFPPYRSPEEWKRHISTVENER